ncbi:MAG: preprotein translocase subunit SecY [Oscillospiraceae bacterium]|nr:preprotein translocase subunit SecY [Oscillospiraceae bacterium]MBQ7054413.1 preprotein translocase subunit SecY [Oscillospiraceae bacterium]MBR3848227.1 preprotein translocase subunit SecY [Oscillospiraceae bacterium]
MIETIKNAWRIPELRKKMIFTLVCLLIFRLGAAIPVPFINRELLEAIFGQYQNTVLGFMNAMSGGSFEQANIFALSIQPYINASIIMQLLAVAIPSLERMVKEGGEEGKKKLASLTRYATIVIALLQGFAYYTLLKNGGAIDSGSLNSTFAAFSIILTFVAGSVFVMWLGEQITENGIGNGISLILFVGIVSRVYPAIESLIGNYANLHWYGIAAILVVFLAVIAFIIFFDGAERRLSIQYAKRVVGRKMYGGRSTHLPVKVNMSGVMPIIFASSIATFPATIAAFFPKPESGFWLWVQENVFSPDSAVYAIAYLLLIIGFSYFYTAIQYNPVEIANNLKNNGGFIPGFRPGRPTAEFIAKVMNKITLFGAFFLGVVAVLPMIVSHATPGINLSIGGTSVIIVVGVALETVKQIESQLMMRNYKGFLE